MSRSILRFIWKQAAWDETVTTRYTRSSCGATKNKNQEKDSRIQKKKHFVKDVYTFWGA